MILRFIYTGAIWENSSDSTSAIYGASNIEESVKEFVSYCRRLIEMSNLFLIEGLGPHITSIMIEREENQRNYFKDDSINNTRFGWCLNIDFWVFYKGHLKCSSDYATNKRKLEKWFLRYMNFVMESGSSRTIIIFI